MEVSVQFDAAVALPLGESASGAQWVRPRASLGALKKRERDNDFSVIHPVMQSLYRLSYRDSSSSP